MEIISQYGFVGIVSFGLTAITETILKRFNHDKGLTSIGRMVLQGVFAFVLLFVPVTLQDVFLNHLKEAVGVVAGSSALWKVVKRV